MCHLDGWFLETLPNFFPRSSRLGGGFKYFSLHWGNDPIWLVCFKRVGSTTHKVDIPSGKKTRFLNQSQLFGSQGNTNVPFGPIWYRSQARAANAWAADRSMLAPGGSVWCGTLWLTVRWLVSTWWVEQCIKSCLPYACKLKKKETGFQSFMLLMMFVDTAQLF